nr:unnamed protein product [Callosobruchus chinensis]
MRGALGAVRRSKMGYLKAVNVYNVPRTTFFRLSKEKGT